MALTIYLEVPINLASSDQVAELYSAVASGMVEAIIKDRVLFGGGATSSPQTSQTREDKSVESSIILREVTPVAKAKPIILEETPTHERARGVLGRTRIGRTGR